MERTITFPERKCGPGTCEVCGKTYQRQSNNSRVCGDDCRRERDKRRNKKPIKGPCTCVACGKQFVGKLPHYPYKCCGAAECRNKIKRLGGKASAKTVAARQTVVEVLCLKCRKLWKSPSKFIRVCPACKAHIGHTFADVWGGIPA